MPAKTSGKQQSGVFQWLYERGEESAGQLLEELFGKRPIGGGLTKGIRRAVRTKGQLDRNMQTLLALLNVPSRADYAKLAGKIEVLQGSILNLNMKLDRLLAATAAPPKGPARRGSAPRPRSTPKEESGN